MKAGGLMLGCLAAVLGGTACGEDAAPPANFAGTYTLAMTWGVNGCNLANWTVDQVTQGVPMTIAHDSVERARIVGRIEGSFGILLNLLFGSNTFQGTVTGDHLAMSMLGREETQGACVATPNIAATATLMGDLLEGSLRLTYATNGAADCGTKQGCSNIIYFNGTRPPGSGVQ